MRVEDEPEGEGKLCWLSEDEVQALLDAADPGRQRAALSLMAQSGLRSKEATLAKPKHLAPTPAGPMLTVPAENSKNSRSRQTPVARTTEGAIGALADDDRTIYDASKRTLARVVKRCASQAGIENADWLSPHDLRRTWATLLREREVDDNCIMRWGGWTDPETYWDHYVGAYSPDFEKQEREKVDWL